MKNFKDTDTALLELSDGIVDETREISENVCVELDKDGNIVSVTIEHAAQVAQLTQVSLEEFGADAAERHNGGADSRAVDRARHVIGGAASTVASSGSADDNSITKSLNGWVWGNLLVGCVVGFAIDFIGGAAYILEPSLVSVSLDKPRGDDAAATAHIYLKDEKGRLLREITTELPPAAR